MTERINTPKLERLPDVCARIRVGKSTIYRWIATGRFPPPVRLGDNTAAWDARLVDRWIEERVNRPLTRTAAIV
jgi:prophage regulatory protein